MAKFSKSCLAMEATPAIMVSGSFMPSILSRLGIMSDCRLLMDDSGVTGAVMLDGGRPAVARFFADTHTFSKDIAGELGQKEH